jgi:pimeloyl-ACP methyl ester carboxylesterase
MSNSPMISKKQFILSGAQGKTITGDLTAKTEGTGTKTIIFVHGFKGFKDWGAHNLVAEYFAKHDYAYVKFNLSHNGVNPEHLVDVTDMESFASNTVSYELVDLTAVINYVKQAYSTTEIYLIGHSRGGGLVILEAERNPEIQKLVTWSAIADFSSLWKQEQEAEWISSGKIYVENARTKEKMPLNSSLLEDYNSHKEEYSILSKAGKIRIPWLILQGDEDVNVDFSVAQRLAQAQPAATIKKINGANHVYGASHPYTAESLPPQLLNVCEKTLAFLNS